MYPERRGLAWQKKTDHARRSEAGGPVGRAWGLCNHEVTAGDEYQGRPPDLGGLPVANDSD